MDVKMFSLLCLISFLALAHGWSGHLCYQRVCHYEKERICSFRFWFICCSHTYVWRQRYRYEPYCCMGWKGRSWDSTSCTVPVCLPNCKNGGTCDRPGHCRCPAGRDGDRCDGLKCSHLTACYPGACQRDSGGTTTTCICEDGFSGTKCLTMDSKLTPSINAIQARMSFWMRGIANPMEKYALTVDSTNKKETDFLWTNQFMFNWINITAVSQYLGKDPPVKPKWIRKAEFGITHAEVNILLIKESFLDPTKKYISKNETIMCNRTFTSLNIGPRSPAPDVVNCTISLPNFDRQLENGDRLTVTFRTKSGGYREVVYSDRPYIHYATDDFKGHWAEKAVEYRFDTDKPKHCKLTNSSCSKDIFSVDNDIHVTNNPIVLNWNGWTDTLSGMFRYAWEVFKLKPDISGRLQEQYPLRPLQITEVLQENLSSTVSSYQPSEPGMYSFILQASDKANNSVFIRRLCLYDPSSKITLGSKGLQVASASGFDKDVWTSNISSPLVVSWKDHFVNKFHEDNKLLNEVKAYPPQLNGLKYITQDDNYGERTIREIPNSRGIVKFEVAPAKDSAGGRSQQEPTTGWQSFSASTLSTTVTPNNPSRGDTVTIWVRATDITGRSKTDKIKVHFDDSPPNALDKVKFTKNVPGKYPFESKVSLTVSDLESGIHQVNLSVIQISTNSVIRTQSYRISTMPKSECQDELQDKCFCSRDQPEMCQKKEQILDINNCWLMTSKEGLKSESLQLKFKIINNAQLYKERAVNISDLLSLNGTNAFLGPMHVSSESVSQTGGRITWDHAPACYDRTEIWIKYGKKGEKLVKKKLHKDAVSEDLTGLEPGTNYTIQLITQYGEVMSEPVNFFLVTEPRPESAGLSGGSVAGIVIGILLLIIIVLLLVAFLLWRTGRFPWKQQKRFKGSNHVSIHNPVANTKVKNMKKQTSVAVTNNAYSPDDEIYYYGSMNFEAKQPWYVQPDHLTLLKLIQTGRFSKIYTAKWKSAPKGHDTVVAKLVKDNHSEEDVLLMMAKINFAATEVGEHPNVLRFMGAVVDNDELGPIMVSEYCESGQLDQWLIKHQGKSTDDTIEKMQIIAMEIAQAMSYLASRNIVHRKLAARNVLLTFIFQAKVTGFGPQRGDREDDDNSKGDRIPVKWTAPECLQTLKNANEKSDVWSYGIVLWEIFSLGHVPYPNIRSRDIAHKLKNGYRLSRPEFCEDIHHKMMQECWSGNPNDRPTFTSLANRLEATFGLRPSSDDFYYYQK